MYSMDRDVLMHDASCFLILMEIARMTVMVMTVRFMMMMMMMMMMLEAS